jgi:ubiquinone/menaquinone biosynthesis C-methylase UbiE
MWLVKRKRGHQGLGCHRQVDSKSFGWLLFTTATTAVWLCRTDMNTSVHAFRSKSSQGIVIQRRCSSQSHMTLAAAKGFGGGSAGGGGFASTNNKKNTKQKASSKPSKETLIKQVERKYGGSLPQDIARGTQVMIDQAIQELPQHVQLALQLHRQNLDWNRRIAGMDILAQSQLPPQLVGQAQHVKEALQALMQEHSLTVPDLQMIMQQITWDASADAKAAKSLTGTMPRDIQNRVQRACDYAAQAVGEDGKVLDVGCGYGVLVPYLKQAGMNASQIHGMDLSREMIRNAQAFYPDVNFEVANFLQLSDKEKYEAVVFCSSLHDLPDMTAALEKAWDLLQSNGVLIVVHPHGASHVAQQHKSNPILVPRGLPTAAELQEWFDDRMELMVAPAEAKSEQEIREGYLAVLTKV